MSSFYLTDDTLGRLDLGPTAAQIAAGECANNGYVVTGWTIGFPQVREVTRLRSLADGTVDDSRFVGSRAVTANITIDQRIADPQVLLDQLMPFVSPRYRPRLHWVIPSGGGEARSAVVRGVDAPLNIVGPKFHVVTAQWVVVDGLLESSEELSQTIIPSGDTELGRHYDAPEDQFGPYYTNTSGDVGRQYPASLSIGSRVVTNPGTAVADWTGVIFGPITNPVFDVNGVAIEFTHDLTAGTTIHIDTKQRTILFNNDPTTSAYSTVNFAEWSWEDVRLQPGDNLVRFQGDTIGVAARIDLTWRGAFF